MKKIFMAIVAMTMLIATSCKKENVNAPENLVPGEGEFLVTIANAPRQNAPAAPSDGMTVKTTIENGKDIIWTIGDEISINGVEYKTEMDGTSVIFKSKGGAAAPDGDGKYKAYYPVEIAGGSLPATIAYDGGNLKNLPMYAESTDYTLTFNNICAALKITVPNLGEESTCNKIVISANENLAGLFSIGTDEETGAPMAVLSGDAGDMSKEITINGNFEAGDLVYVAIPAGTYTNFAIGFLNGETTVMRKMLTNGRTFKVNNLYNLNISNDIPTDDIFHFTALEANAQIAAPTTKNLEYCIYHSSEDAYGSWTTCSTAVTLQAAGDKIYFRVKAENSNSVINNTFTISDGNVSVGGNVMYLLNHNGTTVTMGTNNCFQNLFASQTKLIYAEDLILPAETLMSYCYSQMFLSCSSLETAPALPATNLAASCYYQMFLSCRSLETAPVLDAAKLATQCYYKMFGNCYKLSSVKMLATDASAGQCLDSWLQGASTSGAILTVNNVITTSHTAWSTISNSKNTPSNWTIKKQDGTVLRQGN